MQDNLHDPVVTISGTSPTFDCAVVAVGTTQIRGA